MVFIHTIFALSVGFSFVFAASNVWVPPAAASSPQPNHVRTYTPQVEGLHTPEQVTTSNPVAVRQRTEYLDGRGRVIQRVSRQGSPAARDVVQIVPADPLGRNAVKPLPFTTPDTDGAYKTFDPVAHPLATFYQAEHDKVANTVHPYAITRYDNSPLNRVSEQGAPGDDWQPGLDARSHTVQYSYQTNTAQDAVLRWRPAAGGLRADDIYLPGSLYIEIRSDEQQHRQWVFKDKHQRTVLTLQEADTGEKVYTYFVYDDKGNLAYVVPPSMVQKLAPGMPAVIPASEISKECYAYRYDQRDRVIEKHLPGAEPVFMVYDPWDRLVLRQDGNQRAGDKWTFTKYDALNRVIMSGELTKSGSRSQVDQEVQAFYAAVDGDTQIRYETQGSLHGYTNRSFPLLHERDEVHRVIYFDDYAFVSTFPSPERYHFIPESEVRHTLETVLGYQTGQKTRILGEGSYTHQVMYYNDDYRPVQIILDHQNGINERSTHSYTFQGKLSKVLYTHKKDGVITTLVKGYAYDHAERLMKAYHQINEEENILLYANQYNEIGELVEKNLYSTNGGGTFAQSVDYRYNIRGWLTSINNTALDYEEGKNDDRNDLFGMELYYNEVGNDLGNVAQYNGNVSAVKWKNAHFNEEQSYVYQYDSHNRLQAAQYSNSESIAHRGAYDVSDMIYDASGNILRLKRNSLVDSSKALIDDLNYSYVGNQLQKVIDVSGRREGFYTSGMPGDDYSYDANGNMKNDRNKDLQVTYNHLDLPARVERPSGEHIQYKYDSTGRKLHKEITDNNGVVIKKTDYLGDVVYENETLKYIHHDEGRIVPRATGSGWTYHYYLTDHLGNVRVTFAVGEEAVLSLVTAESEHAAQEEFFKFYDSRAVCPPANHTPAGDQVIEVKFHRPLYPYMELHVTQGQTVEIEGYASYKGTGILAEDGWCGAATPFAGLPPASGRDQAGEARGEEPPQAYINYHVVDEAGTSLRTGRKSVTVAAKRNQEYLQLSPIFIHQDGAIRIFLINVSYAEPTKNAVYFDDVKVVVKKYVMAIVQADDYYPFGLRMVGNHYQDHNTYEVKHLYNKKELQDDMGLDWYDYGARMYDMALGRWHVHDAHAEMAYSHSPYVYTLNNPLRYIDPDGRWPQPVWVGEVIKANEAIDQSVLIATVSTDIIATSKAVESARAHSLASGEVKSVGLLDIVEFGLEVCQHPLCDIIQMPDDCGGCTQNKGEEVNGTDGNGSGNNKDTYDANSSQGSRQGQGPRAPKHDGRGPRGPGGFPRDERAQSDYLEGTREDGTSGSRNGRNLDDDHPHANPQEHRRRADAYDGPRDPNPRRPEGNRRPRRR